MEQREIESDGAQLSRESGDWRPPWSRYWMRSTERGFNVCTTVDSVQRIIAGHRDGCVSRKSIERPITWALYR